MKFTLVQCTITKRHPLNIFNVMTQNCLSMYLKDPVNNTECLNMQNTHTHTHTHTQKHKNVKNTQKNTEIEILICSKSWCPSKS